MTETKRDYISNLYKNALFPISAAAFFIVTDVPVAAKAVGILAVAVLAMFCPNIFIFQ